MQRVAGHDNQIGLLGLEQLEQAAFAAAHSLGVQVGEMRDLERASET